MAPVPPRSWLLQCALLLAAFAVSGQTSTQAADSASGRTVILYYFHSTVRCHSCIKIEEICDDVTRSVLSSEVEQGLLELRKVNTDIAANAHYLKDYKLFTKSVVLVEMQGDKQVRYKVLNKIWEILNNTAATRKYLEKEIRGFVGSPK